MRGERGFRYTKMSGFAGGYPNRESDFELFLINFSVSS